MLSKVEEYQKRMIDTLDQQLAANGIATESSGSLCPRPPPRRVCSLPHGFLCSRAAEQASATTATEGFQKW